MSSMFGTDEIPKGFVATDAIRGLLTASTFGVTSLDMSELPQNVSKTAADKLTNEQKIKSNYTHNISQLLTRVKLRSNSSSPSTPADDHPQKK